MSDESEISSTLEGASSFISQKSSSAVGRSMEKELSLIHIFIGSGSHIDIIRFAF